jgi:hypothetical protein
MRTVLIMMVEVDLDPSLEDPFEVAHYLLEDEAAGEYGASVMDASWAT